VTINERIISLNEHHRPTSWWIYRLGVKMVENKVDFYIGSDNYNRLQCEQLHGKEKRVQKANFKYPHSVGQELTCIWERGTMSLFLKAKRKLFF